jgi:triosephosphate isomerase
MNPSRASLTPTENDDDPETRGVMARKPLMAGNWKMNLNHVEAVGLVQKLAWTLDDKKHDPEKCEVVVLPPFTDLRTVQTLVEGDRLALGYGAQDVSPFENGPYTGDVSATMLAKLGCQYVLVGHSERRQHYGETDQLVNAKAKMALAHGLVPIVCVGEGIQVREEMDQVEFTIALVAEALANLTLEQIGSLVVAYEPVWAIGTGRVATPEDAQEVCGSIREWIGQWYDRGVAQQIRILYGGSVKANNVVDIMAQLDVDGCLVGGASLIVEEFAAIARFYELPALR